MVLASAMLSFGCVSGPSFEKYVETLRDLAGPNGQPCGLVRLGEDRSSALSCGSAALQSGKAFWIAVQVQGVDSRVFVGLARGPKGDAWRSLWDSDVTGGFAFVRRPAIHTATCSQPHLQPSLDLEPIVCTEPGA